MKYYSTALLMLFVLAIGCSGPQKNDEANEKPILVVAATSSTTDTGFTLKASGKLVAQNKANVSTRMMGYITRMQVQVGQAVTAGQMLVNISNNDIVAKGGQVNAQIAQAQAALNNAKKDYDRFLNLYNSQSATAKELDDMRTRYEMAKATVDAGRQMKSEVNAQYAYTNISAPISGVITQVYAKQGDMANPGMPLLTIESPGMLQAEVPVQEEDITSIKKGMKVLMIKKSSGGQMNGVVSEISLSAVSTGGQYMVKINLEKPDANLLPGMIVQVQFPVERNSKNYPAAQNSHITVPQSALVHQGQLTGIYTISQSGTAILRWIRTGNTFGNEVEVLSGLSADERVIVSAEGKLYNGVKVQVK